MPHQQRDQSLSGQITNQDHKNLNLNRNPIFLEVRDFYSLVFLGGGRWGGKWPKTSGKKTEAGAKKKNSGLPVLLEVVTFFLMGKSYLKTFYEDS